MASILAIDTIVTVRIDHVVPGESHREVGRVLDYTIRKGAVEYLIVTANAGTEWFPQNYVTAIPTDDNPRRIEAQELNPGDTIAPLLADESAVVLDVFTREGAYGRTTEIKYRYLDAPAHITSTMRTLATRTFAIVETESANV